MTTYNCAALQLQVAELETEIQCLHEMELQLHVQIKMLHQREKHSIRMHNEVEKEYWDLHDELQKVVNRNNCSPPLPPPPT